MFFSRRRWATQTVTTILVLTLLATGFLNKDKHFVSASLSCNTTDECEIRLRPGSECINSQCSNPFSAGCFRRVLGEDSYPVRVCNSDDDDDSTTCSNSEFNYTEIRVYTGNWESSIFFSWVIQIFLSERLDVPVSLETGGADTPASFYDPSSTFTYGSSDYLWEGLLEADRVGDCRDTTKDCAHVMPEVWGGQRDAWLDAQQMGQYIEPPEGNGEVGKISWYVPRFTAQKDSSLLSYFGLRGDENRQKLAQTFKRPTTWLDYCREVSPSGCNSEDTVAVRPPNTESEEASYYVEGLYVGHFRNTDKNNCTLNPATCTGHIVDASCGWSTVTESQTYWNDIALESDGPLEPNGGYPYTAMVQILHAANATQSDLVTYWWHPDSQIEVFQDSPGEFQPVLLPQPTDTCAKSRVGTAERCDPDPAMRRGSGPEGSCDWEAHALQKAIASSLYENTYKIPKVSRSPGYDALKRLRISDLEMNLMLKKWVSGTVYVGYDAREAVCTWMAENIESLEARFIPPGFPRTIQEESQYREGYLYAAQAVAAFAILAVLVTTAATWKRRRQSIIKYAQVHFLLLILLGFLLVAMGAILYPIEPSLPSCVAKRWFVVVGYTLAWVPLLVKIAAINHLAHEAERMRRVKISTKYLFAVVALVVAAVVIYLIVWTVLDPPTKEEEKVLAQENGNVVVVSLDCASSSDVWMMVSLGWELLLCVVAVVLAFQARNLRQEFNESRSLATLSYSHFIFTILRLAVYLMSSILAPNVRAAIQSFLLSLDTISGLIIYYAPKFMASNKRQTNIRQKSQRFAGIQSGVSMPRLPPRFVAGSEPFQLPVAQDRVTSTSASSDTGVLESICEEDKGVCRVEQNSETKTEEDSTPSHYQGE